MNLAPTLSTLRRTRIAFGVTVQLNPLQWRVSFKREHYNALDTRASLEVGPITLEVFVND